MSQIAPKPYWYLRHGETDWNRQGLAQGRTDIPLNETGLTQAARAGNTLAELFQNGQRPFDRIISSPLSRAFVTATHTRDAIRDLAGVALPFRVDEDLAEVCFGVQEGTLMGDWYEPWIEQGHLLEGGESFHTLTQRAVTAINRELEAGGTPLFVAHGALFRGLRAGMALPVNVRLPNAVPMYLEPGENGWTIHTPPLI
ncbi:histidine phosphatase family protein [Gluconobacter roseus]|uniref:Fructose 1,6-bisphosphatase n=1 Tax=Gluconobacter roseus NBRC 3990 TaxID=1307950 RepID=A0A4Y3M4F5_9PROT|nr:histidine phosphatase family protein [Gluconobacter roseus]KXV42692.1 phosphoglycerate mutase [Gluconobacter roseus]GBR49400.1 phosphoglycerate mutase [Gluconobacter roseus NBRC 3990]GEB04130.1 fructose 1,6-bisphosphatase [Gluconobacter roseus NBRC 3990]GLP92575.1 fructose 1,6-bisphosphatase [Gluconobacter roseus NBRC 3990]